MARQVLCVGDDVQLLDLRCRVLGRAGYDSTAARPDDAVKLLRASRFDAVLFSRRVTTAEIDRVLAAAPAGMLFMHDESNKAGQDLINAVNELFGGSKASSQSNIP